jgi:predicted dehydrogenase
MVQKTPLAMRSPSKTRILIVGFGRMGQLHLQALRGLPEAEVIGAVDANPDRKAPADAAGLPFAMAVDDLADAADAAIVATTSDDHAVTCLELLRLGIDCLVEKPIALDPGDARRMVEAAGDHTVLAVGQSERFNPGLDRALIAMQTFRGDVVVRRTARLAPEESMSDVIQDLMVHDLDWILLHEGFASPSLEIVRAVRTDGKLGDVTCRLRFESRTYEVASLYADGMPERTVTLRPEGHPPSTFSLRQDSFGSGADPLTRQASSFLALRQGAPALICTGKEALQVLELTEQLRHRCDLGPERAALESSWL